MYIFAARLSNVRLDALYAGAHPSGFVSRVSTATRNNVEYEVLAIVRMRDSSRQMLRVTKRNATRISLPLGTFWAQSSARQLPKPFTDHDQMSRFERVRIPYALPTLVF